ncbi:MULTISPECIES: polymer-forming cytoskeletal protein [unclassified Bacteroides]|jgi:hypothetical protein|uniref:polymer-forming cytoskeletal protein n=1 Tax=unclassified Bacteroides TaxID=2646097 RepID=UPI000E816663|nr:MULTISPECIES: polymer-forming cytoskeletal protein [unclassified Bacteroides]RGN50032.1 polymer-forming cytoskeletal protein [Bacteroides sp. OM05-12]RHR75158.1 polymer-forming cytoskeletal protein [Bacteroides sp. AF16-49]DAU20740.1 MAG TPA: tail protein [Caudoviricetes sp.]
MDKIDIKDIQGNLRFSTIINKEGKRRFYLMKEDYITLKFSVDDPVYFQLGDYAEYDNELFEIVDLVYPSLNKSTGGYDYELRLDAPYWKWKHKIIFYDRQGNKEAAWNLTRNPDAHMSVVKSNLASLGYTYKGDTYDFSIDYNVVEDKPIFLQYSNTNIIDAITMIAEACECEWWVKGNTIYLGKCELSDEPVIFELGSNVNEMSRDKSDSTYATRIYAFGSTRNITPYYRKNLIFKATSVLDYNDGEGIILIDSSRILKTEHFLASTKELVFENKGFQTMYRNGFISYEGRTLGFKDFPSFKTSQRYSTILCDDLNVYLSVKRVEESDGAFPITYVIGRVELENVTHEKSHIIHSFETSYDKDGVYKIAIPNHSIGDIPENEEIKLKIFLWVSKESSDVESIFQVTVGGSIGMKGKDNNRTQVKFLGGKFEGQSFDALFLGYNQELFVPGLKVNDVITGTQYKPDKLKYGKIPSGWFTSDHADDDLVVEGIVEKRLMLPSGITFIGDKDLPMEKVVEQVVVFEDVYPKREGIVATVTTHEYTETTEDENGNVISEEKWNAYRITDTDENFYFSKDYVITGRDLKITFQTGDLAGMKFNVWFNPYDNKSPDKKQEEKNPDGSWNLDAQVFEIVRNEDYGRKLPAEDMNPKPGDKYILEGYDPQFISDAIIPLAEIELQEKAQKYADKLKIDPSVYNCNMFSYKDDRYSYLQIGRKINLLNPTYFEDGRVSRIIGFEKKLDIPYDSPVYMVGESQTYSRIGALEDKVDSLTFKGLSYTNSVSGGSNVYVISRYSNVSPSDANVFSASRALLEHLSKKNDDEASGLITFLGGLLSDSILSRKFTSGILGSGLGLFIDKNGKSILEVDNLLVRMKAIFHELIIEKLSHVGGEIVLSPASMRCIKVEELEDAYRCYFKGMDDDKVIYNEFALNDQARCQTFNVRAGILQNISNQYYWRLVVGVGDDYIDLSKTDCDTGSDIPQAGDDIVQLGNRDPEQEERQNAIILSSYGPDAPSIKQYMYIDHYTLEGKECTVVSPHGNVFTGDFYLKNGDLLMTVVENMFKTELNKLEFFFTQSNNFLANALFVENLDGWEVLNSDIYKDTDSILLINGELFAANNSIANIEPYKGENALHLKNNGIKQQNGNIKDWIPDTYYITIRYACVESGTLEYGFTNGNLLNTVQLSPTNEYKTITSTGQWDGYSNFILNFSGNAYILYVILTNKDSAVINLASSIEQLINRITLSVSKNNVVSSINLTPETIKIEGKNIELKGATSFNGNVQITTDGNIHAKNAYIEGEIHATSGTFDGDVMTSGVYANKITYINNDNIDEFTEKITNPDGTVLNCFIISKTGLRIVVEKDFDKYDKIWFYDLPYYRKEYDGTFLTVGDPYKYIGSTMYIQNLSNSYISISSNVFNTEDSEPISFILGSNWEVYLECIIRRYDDNKNIGWVKRYYYPINN